MFKQILNKKYKKDVNDLKIDAKKILESRKTEIQKSYEFLQENYTAVNSINFMNLIRRSSIKEILENTEYIINDSRGTDFLSYVLKSNDLSIEDIQMQMENINKFTQDKKVDHEHLEKINECLNYLNTQKEKKESLEFLKEDTKLKLITSRLPKPILENSIVEEMDIIIQNINYQPEMAEKYEELLHEIRQWKGSTTLLNFVPLIIKNTSLILGLTIFVTGSVISLIISLPLLLVSKLIENRVEKRYISSYILIITKEIKTIEEAIKSADPKKKTILENYIHALKQTRERLMKYDVYLKNFKGIREGITEMQPIVTYEDFDKEIELQLNELREECRKLSLPFELINESLVPNENTNEEVTSQNQNEFADVFLKIKEYLISTYDFWKDPHPDLCIKEKLFSCSFGTIVSCTDKYPRSNNQINLLNKVMNDLMNRFDFVRIVDLNSVSYLYKQNPLIVLIPYLSFVGEEVHMSISLKLHSDTQIPVDQTEIEEAFYNKFVDLFMDESDDISLESFNEFINLLEKYNGIMETKDIILESDGRKSIGRKVALKGEEISKGVVKTVRNAQYAGKHTAVVAKRIPAHIENLINNTINKIKEMDKNERRNRIVEGSFRLKLMKIIRNAIIAGVGWYIKPALTAIGILVGYAVDKKSDKKVRNQILHELQTELNIVNEKIDDARSGSDKQKKYQLMRIKNKLETDIERIRYKLD